MMQFIFHKVSDVAPFGTQNEINSAYSRRLLNLTHKRSTDITHQVCHELILC